MKGRELILAGLSLTLVCTILLLASLVMISYEQAERTVTLILSAEILTPAIIFGLALAVYFSRKSHQWRYPR